MKIIGGNRFALEARSGEEITVSVASVGTVHLVTYIITKAQPVGVPAEGSMTEGVPLRFRLSGAPMTRNTLSLSFTFATPEEVAGVPVPENVEYSVRVTSNVPGSDESRDVVSGAFGIPGDGRDWDFFLK